MKNNPTSLTPLLFILAMIISINGSAQILAANIVASGIYHNKTIKRDNSQQIFSIAPASVKNKASLLINADKDGWATFIIKGKSGKILLSQYMAVSKGLNKIPVFFISGIDKGTYTTRLRIEENTYSSELIKE